MKKNEQNDKESAFSNNLFIKTFTTQEEAERFNMIEVLKKSDMEKFHLFCRMMRIGKMLSSAKVIK